MAKMPSRKWRESMQQPNRAKKPSFFSFGRKNKRSADPDSHRQSETDTSGLDEPRKGPPSNISEPVLDVVQMIKEAKDKAGLGATDSSSRASSPERERPPMQPPQPQMQQPRPKLPEPLDLPRQSESSSDYDQRQNVLSRPLSPPKKSGGGFGSLFRCEINW